MPGGLNPPVSVIESWPTANVVNPTLRDNTFIVIILTFLVLSTLIVSARLWARGVIQRSFALDDYLILGAILCTASMGISSCLGIHSAFPPPRVG
jgi:hypothetical protein